MIKEWLKHRLSTFKIKIKASKLDIAFGCYVFSMFLLALVGLIHMYLTSNTLTKIIIVIAPTIVIMIEIPIIYRIHETISSGDEKIFDFFKKFTVKNIIFFGVTFCGFWGSIGIIVAEIILFLYCDYKDFKENR